MAKASKPATPKAKKETAGKTIDTAHDPFAGFVFLKTDGKKFWAVHERKGISSAPGSKADAQAAFDSYVNDTQFA